MSNCIIPNWNVRQQRQQVQVEGEEGINNRSSSHVQSLNNNHSYSIPISNYDVTAELTWENGQPAMHGFGDFTSYPQISQDELKHEPESSYIRSQGLPNISTKPTWINTNDSLESIVHQATYQNQNINMDFHQNDKNEHIGSSSMAGKWTERMAGNTKMPPSPVVGLLKKRVRSESDQCGKYFSCGNINQEEMNIERSSTCASASAMFNENDHHTTTMMTWPSSESLRSVKTKTTDEDHSACHGGSEKKNEKNDTKGETVRSQTTRSSRAAAVHNQSERRRRDRINQKMKALQKLVPNASKTDKASMLDEVISYLKQLQTQIHIMSARSVPAAAAPPQMMMHPGMLQQQQQQLHMSQLLARMGMGGVGLAGMGGMGMLDMNNMARSATHQSLSSGLIHPATMAAATFTTPPPFAAVPQISTRPPSQGNTDANAYFACLAQSMNMELYNKMAALFQQQANHQSAMQTSSTSSKSNNVVKRKS